METVKKYRQFRDLIADVARQNKPDLFHLRQDGKLVFVSGKAWADRVLQKEKDFRSKPFSSIAIVESRSPEMASDLFGAVLAGKRILIIDPMEQISKIERMVSFCDCEEILLDDSFTLEETDALRAVCHPATDKASLEEGELLFFTSGTSGSPKACILTSASLLSSSFNGQSRLPCGKKDLILSLLPLSHVFGFVCSFLWPLCYGGSIAFGSGLKTLGQDVLFYQPTILPVIPSLAGFLLISKAINPNLETLLVGAGPLSLKAIQAYQALGKKVAFGYGLTETSSGVAISVGAKDPFAMTPCPEDHFRIEADGTISIQTSCLMKGYYKNSAATNQAIQDGWLKTADRGYLDPDGNLYVLGRVDDIAVLDNGTKFDCNAGEEKLLNSLAVPLDLALGVSGGKLTLFVFLARPDLKPLLEQAVEGFNFASDFYTKISAIVYAKTPLPRTRTGKVIRRQLADLEV